MTNEATKLLETALKTATIDGSFSPAAVGAKVGLSKAQAESAARSLSNAGVLVLGFDCDAHFTSDYRRANKSQSTKRRKK
jgi:hypothetical protein